MKYHHNQQPKATGDVYLKAAATAKAPVSIFFLDGEEIPHAVVKEVYQYSILLSVQGNDVIVYKTALKKITSSAAENGGQPS